MAEVASRESDSPPQLAAPSSSVKDLTPSEGQGVSTDSGVFRSALNKKDLDGTSSADSPPSRPAKCCGVCGGGGVCMRRMNGQGLRCRSCFCREFEEEVFRFIEANALLPPSIDVCLGVSGGKDSVALLHVLHVLNQRHRRQWRLKLLAIDEGIRGYRDKALEAAEAAALAHGLSLTVLSYAELFEGWSMDNIHSLAAVPETGSSCERRGGGGFTSYCSYCGVFRRQALQRGAELLGARVVATGHNLDDCAETALLNLTRGDASRLPSSADPGKSAAEEANGVRRVKPLLRSFQKEIVLYVHFQKLPYFATECSYSWGASRGEARNLLTQFQVLKQPQRVLDLVRAASLWLSLPKEEEASRREEGGAAPREAEGASFKACDKCGAQTTNTRCRACVFVDLLNQRATATASQGTSRETARTLQKLKVKTTPPRVSGSDSF